MKELVLEGLQHLEEYLKELIPALQASAGRFRTGDEAGANQIYAQCVEGLQMVTDLVGKVREAQAQGAVSQKSLFLAHRDQRLLDLLREMFHAQSEQDWVFLADLMEYELVPVLKEIQEELPGARQAMAEA